MMGNAGYYMAVPTVDHTVLSTGSYCGGVTAGVCLKDSDTECGSNGTNRKFILGNEVNYGERQQSVSVCAIS